MQRKLEQGIAEPEQAERALRDQYTFLQLVLDSVVCPLYVINADTYIVEMANASAQEGSVRRTATCYALTHSC